MIRFPFFNMQELNLDWMMEKLKALLKFIPQNGSAGDVLQRTYDGAVWQPIAAISMDINSLQVISDVQPEDAVPVYDDSAQGNYKALIGDIIALSPVQSVNGQTGNVVLNIPAVPVESVNGQTGEVVLDATDVGAMPDSYVAPVTSVNGQTGDVIVTAPVAVDSVNGQTGTVVLDAADVGAMPDTYVAPVTSVNGQTGAVNVSAALTLTLLWTNPDTTVEFPYQTIPLDLSLYTMIIVETIDGGYNEQQFSILAIPAGSTIITYVHGSEYKQRTIGCTTSGVNVGLGATGTYNSSSTTTNNHAVKPYRIYGVK